MERLSYKNFLLLSLVLAIAYAGAYFVPRTLLGAAFVEGAGDFWRLSSVGFLLDLRAISFGIAPLVLLGYFWALLAAILGRFDKSGRIQRQERILRRAALIYSALLSFLVAFSALGNYFYVKTYQNKIDLFIFGLKDDETAGILEIIFQNYPVFWLLLICVVFTILVHFLARRILLLRFKDSRPIFHAMLNLGFLALLIVAMRGGVGTFPLRENNFIFSTKAMLNHAAANPVMAFSWALKHYLQSDKFAPPPRENYEENLAAILHENVALFEAKGAAQNRPHIVVALLESFGNNALYFDRADSLDLLGDFRAHFEGGLRGEKMQIGGGRDNRAQKSLGAANPKAPKANESAANESSENLANLGRDFTFRAGLSGGNGTMTSFVNLFFNSPSAALPNSKMRDKRLEFSPISVYQNAGYEVVYITSGTKEWQNLGRYVLAQGASAVFDATYAKEYFKGEKIAQNAFGVEDKYAYKIALEVLKNAKKPTLIVLLSTNNHPPYIDIDFSPQIRAQNYDTREIGEVFFDKKHIEKALRIFTYSSDEFGRFVSEVKASPLGESTIIAASGDHILRDVHFKDAHELVLGTSVPIYFYIPARIAANLDFDPATLASHDDIFPTLYALSLESGARFLSIAGKNLFAKKPPKMAQNYGLFIDECGVYANGAAHKYELENNFIIARPANLSPKDSPKCESSDFKNAQNAAQKYNELRDFGLRWQLFLEEGQMSYNRAKDSQQSR